MVEFAKRPEITVETMGKVHNPSGEGVKAVSSQLQAKKNKIKEEKAAAAAEEDGHETKGLTEGSSKRNIQRKKTDGQVSGNFDSKNKKQGGSGKGQWKNDQLVSIDDDYKQPLDVNDPLYDEQEDNYILTADTENGNGGELRKVGYDPVDGKAIYGPMLTNSEFKVQLAECLKEYFDSCDADEVIRTLLELNCQEFHSDIIKKSISLAMDKGPRERELTSRLLTSLHPTPMSDKDMETGFEQLLDSLDDLCMDVPDAKSLVACFVARAVVDEVLPPAFLSEQNNTRPGDAVVEKALSLLNREHCTARLERIWGPGDGRPVDEIKKEMDHLLKEYLLSRELDEAARCVKELDAPHFHHELVKRGVNISMEIMDGNKTEDDLDAMAALFGFLVRNAIISEYQVQKGISRLHQRLPDMSLDIPAAAGLLAEFERLAREGGCLGNIPIKDNGSPKVEDDTKEAEK